VKKKKFEFGAEKNMKKTIGGIIICILLITSTSTLALTPFNKNEKQTKNQFFDAAPIPLLTSKGWMKTYGGGDSDQGNSVRQTSDGGYIIVGSTFSFGAGQADFWVIKTDSKGNMVWNMTFGGAGWDVASDVKQTNDNGYIITGRTHSFGSGNIDVWVIKLDEMGNIQWNKTFGTQYFEGGIESQQTTDGGYIIIGSKGLDQFSQYDAWLIKIDKEGNMQWNQTYGGRAEDYGHSVRQMNDGGYIIAGSTSSYGTFRNSTAAFWLIKTDEQGTMQWDKTYGGTEYDAAISVELTFDGGYIMVGNKYNLDSHQNDIWLVKTDRFGDEQWNKTYGGNLDDYSTQAYQTSDGGYIMIGWTSSYGAGAEDAWMIKTDGSGNEQWNRTYGGKSFDAGYAFNQSSDGGYIITGGTGSFGKDAYHGDLWLIKTDSQGKAKTTSLDNLWFGRFFQRFPNAFPILKHLTGY
jgi:hypothetical protein